MHTDEERHSRASAFNPRLTRVHPWLKPEGPRSDSRCHRVGLAAGLPFGRPRSGGVFRRAPILVSDRYFGNLLPAWARLGPLSRGDACDRASSTDGVVATVSAATAHPTGWLGGIPTGRPWGFALGTLEPRKAQGFPRRALAPRPRNRGFDPSLPDPTPRICPTFAGRYQPAAPSWVRRPGCRKAFPSRSEAPRAATVTRIAMALFKALSLGWPRREF
jgi:hypothetical protein